jgi:hypothetical protein
LFRPARAKQVDFEVQPEARPSFGVSTNGVTEEHDPLSLVEKAPIEETEKLARAMAQIGEEHLEFGWFYGSSEDPEYFTSVYVPLALGIVEMANGNNFHGRSWDDKIRRRTLHKLLGDTFTVVVPYLAVRPETKELGVQLISRIPENETGFRNRYSTFFPMEQLLLMKDIAEYLPQDMRDVIQGMSHEQLYEFIRQQENEDNTLRPYHPHRPADAGRPIFVAPVLPAE